MIFFTYMLSPNLSLSWNPLLVNVINTLLVTWLEILRLFQLLIFTHLPHSVKYQFQLVLSAESFHTCLFFFFFPSSVQALADSKFLVFLTWISTILNLTWYVFLIFATYCLLGKSLHCFWVSLVDPLVPPQQPTISPRSQLQISAWFMLEMAK